MCIWTQILIMHYSEGGRCETFKIGGSIVDGCECIDGLRSCPPGNVPSNPVVGEGQAAGWPGGTFQAEQSMHN